jgi:TolB-like protein/DNA-binding winged helix-turn-helix (wHTH) protein
MTTGKAPLSIDLAGETDFALGKLRIRPSLREVECAGEKEPLEPRVMQVLVALARRRGEVTSRDQLVQECWAGRVVGEDALQRCIAKVRRLAQARGSFAIETIARVGYRLTETAVVPEPVPASAVPIQPQLRSRRYLLAASTVAIMLLAIASYFGLVQWRAATRQAQPPVAATQAGKLRLAVMPLDNFSPDPANAFFAEGLHEEILSTLASRTTDIDVISRTTMMTYRDTAKSTPDIARELRVTHVLEGSVRREGESVRLTLQLIDAVADAHVWSQSYDRTLEKAITLQSEVASEVAGQLAVKLAGYTEQLALTISAEAYDLYLRANVVWPEANSAAALKAVEDMLTRAIALDPAFAKAYVHRARARLDGLHQSFDTSDEALQAIRADVTTARDLVGDNNLTLMSQAAEALIAEQDLEKAAELVGKTTALEPLDANQLTIRAQVLMASGRPQEAFAVYQEATRLDPANIVPAWHWTSQLFAARRPVDAMRVIGAFNAQSGQQVSRVQDVFAFTGAIDRWHAEVDPQLAPGIPPAESAATPLAAFSLLRFEHRYAELADWLDRSSITTVRETLVGNGLMLSAIGEKPLAELSGWARLMLQSPSAGQLPARAEGQVLLDFVQREPATRWNGWVHHLLAAEGALFTGDNARAIREARIGIELAAAIPYHASSLYAKMLAARVYAWAGEEDEAVDLLEQLSTGSMTIGPAMVTRDPLYVIPLANNARYQALSEKLEAEIMRNQALL